MIRSKIKERSKAPKQGSEGAPDAWLEVHPFATLALDGREKGAKRRPFDLLQQLDLRIILFG